MYSLPFSRNFNAKFKPAIKGVFRPTSTNSLVFQVGYIKNPALKPKMQMFKGALEILTLVAGLVGAILFIANQNKQS